MEKNKNDEFYYSQPTVEIKPMANESDVLTVSAKAPSMGAKAPRQHQAITRTGSVASILPPDKSRTAPKAGYTWNQKLFFINFNVLNFCSAMCISLQAPFYPMEAERKGATPSQYGFVFGVFELVVFLISPLYGKYMRHIGPKFMMNAGIFITSFCCCLFGFLDRTPPGTPFLALSFIVRIVAAVGEAGFITASNTIIVREFPDTIGTTFAFMKTSFGLGLIAGPTMGGFLYEIGGFTLPFIVIGGVMFLAGIATAFLLPDKIDEDVPVGGDPSHTSMLAAFRVPAVAIAGFAVTSTSISIGFTSAILEPHLRQFNLPPTLTGLMFIVSGGVYALTSPIWGRLCDTFGRPKLLCGIAAVFMCIAFLFIGPAPFFPFKTQLWLSVVALVFQGAGIGGELVSAYIDALQDVIKSGFPDNVDTYGLVNGIWNSLFALGAFLGPSVGGILFDSIGFRMGSMVVLSLHVVVAILFLGYYSFETSHCREPQTKDVESSEANHERTPLLSESSPS